MTWDVQYLDIGIARAGLWWWGWGGGCIASEYVSTSQANVFPFVISLVHCGVLCACWCQPGANKVSNVANKISNKFLSDKKNVR